ncbi:MAG: SDR family NAD(P)-dependent oxidoreductase [Xanthomonadales bacterium]|nr:SDR family NAD(P)-dependent oxidoreductase [Xanthomonadales bacterium]
MSLLATADGIEALVAGASSGIGLALVEQLLQSGFAGSPIVRVHALARSVNRSPALSSLQDRVGPRLRRWAVDLADPTAIDRFGRALHSEGARPNLICHAAAVLHDGDMQPERSVVQLDPAHLQRALMVNAVAPVLMARALWPLLRGRGPLLLTALSARVGSIGDNRLGGWYAYRASKAALNQLYRTLSIELARVNPQACCLLLHPGTVDTPLSRPFQAGVKPNRLFAAERAAAQLLRLLQGVGTQDNGRFLAWDGSEVPW